jgi:hypothetical protein
VSIRQIATATSGQNAALFGSDAKWDYVHYNCNCTQTRVDGCRYEFSRPFNAVEDFSRRFIGINGAGLLWEVVPFSFVIDWFIHIDDVLDTLWLNSAPGIKTQFWSSTKTENMRRWTMRNRESDTEIFNLSPNPGELTIDFKPISDGIDLSHKWTRYNRIRRDNPVPLDSLRLTLPGIRNVYNLALIAAGLMR